MVEINEIKDRIIKGYNITKKEALNLLDVPSEELFESADQIRQHFCGNKFDACTIINVKSGKCSEDCKFCAQSSHYKTNIEEYPLLSGEELKKQTMRIYDSGFKRISYVASGKIVSRDEFNTIRESIRELKRENSDIKMCLSLGLLSEENVESLKNVGVDRIHNNLETSEKYFENICTTHHYRQKLETLENISNVNLKICSGGIFGLGEDFEDRIDLAIKLREYNIQSIPINVLNPIKNTPLENNRILSNEEVCKIVALFRFINPKAYIRMAGGRLLLEDNGKQAFKSGANAAILGNMLTTHGVSYDDDLKMINELGYHITYEF